MGFFCSAIVSTIGRRVHVRGTPISELPDLATKASASPI